MSDWAITSPRLRLRRCLSTDLQTIHQLHSIPEVDQYNTLGIPEDLATTQAVMEPLFAAWQQEPVQRYTLIIEQLSDEAVVGMFGFNLGSAKYNNAEIWYKFFPAYWGKGYATESLQRMLRFGFDDLKLHRITAGCAVDNVASIRVLEKVGMQREGRCRQLLPLKAGWSDNFEYAILEGD